MTNEQINDILMASVSNINDRCLMQLGQVREQVGQLRDTMKRYIDDPALVNSDFQEHIKNEKLNVVQKCIFAVAESATVEEAKQKCGAILADIVGLENIAQQRAAAEGAPVA